MSEIEIPSLQQMCRDIAKWKNENTEMDSPVTGEDIWHLHPNGELYWIPGDWYQGMLMYEKLSPAQYVGLTKKIYGDLINHPLLEPIKELVETIGDKH